MLPTRCFSRWLSAGGKSLGLPPSTVQSSAYKPKKCQRLASSPLPETCGARPPNPRARLKAAVGLGLLRRFPLPPRRVGLCQPRDRWGPRARLWSQGEKQSGSPRAVHFPEPWDLHPGLGSDKCSLLRGEWGAQSAFPSRRQALVVCVRFPSWSGVGLCTCKTADWSWVRATWRSAREGISKIGPNEWAVS